MDNVDLKREYPHLYAPKTRDIHLVEVPLMHFLMVDGHGDPNTSPVYRDAVEALFTLSYAVRSVAKRTLGRVHTVAPLEGLWSAKDWNVFLERDKSAWDWTMMIAQPDWITPDIVTEAREAAAKKKLPALTDVRFEEFAEGPSVQVLHIGPYDDEAPTIARMHQDFMPAQGLRPRGRHHEIYLSDPRKVAPAKLKTILRQSVERFQVERFLGNA